MEMKRSTLQDRGGNLRSSALPGHMREIGEQFLLDLKTILQPGQAPLPLILAVALGTMLSFVPAPFLDSLLVGIILARYRQINRPLVLAARMVWNDLIVVPLYVPGFRLGMRFLQILAVDNGTPQVRIAGFALGVVALASAATIASVLSMFCLLLLLRQWQRKGADVVENCSFSDVSVSLIPTGAAPPGLDCHLHQQS